MKTSISPTGHGRTQTARRSKRTDKRVKPEIVLQDAWCRHIEGVVFTDRITVIRCCCRQTGIRERLCILSVEGAIVDANVIQRPVEELVAVAAVGPEINVDGHECTCGPGGGAVEYAIDVNSHRAIVFTDTENMMPLAVVDRL